MELWSVFKDGHMDPRRYTLAEIEVVTSWSNGFDEWSDSQHDKGKHEIRKPAPGSGVLIAGGIPSGLAGGGTPLSALARK